MRIVTRPDFDGIVCAVLLKAAMDIREPILWVEPNRMHLGEVDIHEGDVIANLAYDERCSFWFDHHSSNRIETPYQGRFQIAPSAARVVYGYFDNMFQGRFQDLVMAADKIDSARLSREEVLHPEKYSYLLISDTISSMKGNDAAYWDLLVDLFSHASNLEEILENPEVHRRTGQVRSENQRYRKILKQHTRMVNRISITDLRAFDVTPAGNRFLVFSLFPKSNVNVKIRRHDREPDHLIVSIGHSIFNRTCSADAGSLCAAFGGGGHFGAGSCSFHVTEFDKNIKQILNKLS